MKRFLAVVAIVGGLAYALGKVYRDGWTAGWLEAALLPMGEDDWLEW